MRGSGIDCAEPARVCRIVGKHHLQLVAAFIIEVDRPLRPVDFQRDEVVATPSVARGLKAADGSVAEAQHRHHLVIHIHRRTFGIGGFLRRAQLVHPALLDGARRDIGLGHRDHLGNGTDEVMREVHHMGPDIPDRARPRDLFLEAPGQRPVLIRRPVLKIGPTEVQDTADAAFLTYLSGLVNRSFSATQYALLSSLAAVPLRTLGASAGVLAQSLGWWWFFVLTTLAALPAMAIMLILLARCRL